MGKWVGGARSLPEASIAEVDGVEGVVESRGRPDGRHALWATTKQWVLGRKGQV